MAPHLCKGTQASEFALLAFEGDGDKPLFGRDALQLAPRLGGVQLVNPSSELVVLCEYRLDRGRKSVGNRSELANGCRAEVSTTECSFH